jgi:ABC-type nitrate/sulfonate/bicarbonate transport system permease component
MRMLMAGRLGGVVVYARAMLGLAIVWHLGSLWMGNPVLLPPPMRVVEALWSLIRDLELFEHAAISLTRMLIALSLASCIAIPLGFLMGMSRFADDLIDPVIEVLRPISGIAWIPLGLFIFGVGHTLPTYIMFYSAFFPVLLGTIAGVRGVDRRLIDAARTMGVGQAVIVRRVVLPAAIPSILVALRLGVAASWTAVVAAELVGAPSGLGYSIEWYRELLETPFVMAFIATIGFFGFVTDALLRKLHRALTPWAPQQELMA